MKNPTVSICIPVYNGIDFLSHCLDSVLAQTYTSLEILIVDDCSTDGSVELIEKYVSNNPSIRFVRNALNIGLTANWNKCIQLSSGEWIKFIFQDDFLEENCIEVFVEYIKKHNGVHPLLVSKRRFLTDSGLSSKEDLYYSKRLPTIERINLKVENDFIPSAEISNAAVNHMAMNFIGEPTVVMFKREVTLDVGLFNEDLEQICDLEFVLRIASMKGLVYIPFELTIFRIHAQSTTSRNIAKKYYSLSNLEPVKLSHLLLFDTIYSDFRLALTRFNRFKLKMYYSIRGNEAYLNAQSEGENMNSFNLAVEKFPHMKDLREIKAINRFLLTLIKLKRGLKKIAGR